MNNEQQNQQLKKEQVRLRIYGIILMIAGYGFAFAAAAAESPLTILPMILAFAGIIMILRSFMHAKYKNTK